LSLAALILAGGVYPQPIVASRHSAAMDLFHQRDGQPSPAAAKEPDLPMKWLTGEAAPSRHASDSL
jgi:hypothetical protein